MARGDKPGTERAFLVDTLKGKLVSTVQKTEMAGSEKGKLLPTDIGIVVNDFLVENFPEIMEYNFTARVEQQFDHIAEGKEEWKSMINKFDKDFTPVVEKVMKTRTERKVGERELGTDPKSGKPVTVKIGRFGPMVQIGTAEDEEKPKFSQIPKDKSMETITLDEALELFKLPREIGEYEGLTVTIGKGRFGPYIQHNKKYVSLPKTEDPMTVTLDTAIELINAKREQEKERHIKLFEQDSKMELLKGRYGPYIAYDGHNFRIEKKLHERALAGDLSFEECKTIVETAPEPKPRRKK